MAHMEFKASDDLCWHIITAISEERDVDPMRIDEQLEDVIDVEALGRLVQQAGDDTPVDLSVSLRLSGCFVTVTGNGEVRASCPG